MTYSGERLSSSHTLKSAVTHKVQTKLNVFHCNEYTFLYEFNKINALSAFLWLHSSIGTVFNSC